MWERYHSLSQICVLEGEELKVGQRRAPSSELALISVQSVKGRVFEALGGEDVERNERGEVALHGCTVWAWTTSIPGAPLREGG